MPIPTPKNIPSETVSVTIEVPRSSEFGSMLRGIFLSLATESTYSQDESDHATAAETAAAWQVSLSDWVWSDET